MSMVARYRKIEYISHISLVMPLFFYGYFDPDIQKINKFTIFFEKWKDLIITYQSLCGDPNYKVYGKITKYWPPGPTVSSLFHE